MNSSLPTSTSSALASRSPETQSPYYRSERLVAPWFNLALLLALTCLVLTGCIEAERDEVPSNVGPTAAPVPDTTPMPNTNPNVEGRPAPAIDVAFAVPGVCDTQPVLSVDDVATDSDFLWALPSFEEETSLGRVSKRVHRKFDASGELLLKRTEQFTELGCLGIVTTEEFADVPVDTMAESQIWNANPSLTFGLYFSERHATRQHSLIKVEVLDEDFGFNVSPYVPVQSQTREWTLDDNGAVIALTIDAGNDGMVDERITIFRDEAGRPLLREVEFLEHSEEHPFFWSWNSGVPHTEWTWDGDDKVEQVEVYDHLTQRQVWTFEGGLQVGYQKFTDDALIVDETWAHDANGRLVDHNRMTQNQFGVISSFARTHWTRLHPANEFPAISELDESFGGVVTDRFEVRHFDTLGNVTLYEQDQPFDGVVDWRETYTHDASGNLLRELVESPDEVHRDIRHTYDGEGRLVRTDGNPTWGGRQVIEYTYDARGRLIRQADTRDGEHTRLRVKTYDDRDNMTREEVDYDGDNVFDQLHVFFFDQLNQQVGAMHDNNADGEWDSTYFIVP